MSKIAVVSITLERAEGPSPLPKPVTVQNFADANVTLLRWSRNAPKGGGYDKVDFHITFADGATYDGRFDMSRDLDGGTDDKSLEAHVQHHCAFYAGVWMPQHFITQSNGNRAKALETYRRLVADGPTASYKQLLDTYDLGPARFTPNTGD